MLAVANLPKKKRDLNTRQFRSLAGVLTHNFFDHYISIILFLQTHVQLILLLTLAVIDFKLFKFRVRVG